MSQIRPVLLAVAFAVLASAAPVAAVTPAVGATELAPADTVVPVRENPNSSNYFDVEQDAVERGEHGEASLDVGAALRQEGNELNADLGRRAFEVEYADAANDSERNARLRAEVERLTRRIDEVESRQQRAIERYNADELTADEFLRELAAVDAAAREVAARFDHLREHAGFALSDELDAQLVDLETRLIPLRGPVTTQVRAATTGQGSPAVTYALTSSDAVVLGTTDGTQFYREARVPDNRALNEPNQFVTEDDPGGLTAANERGRELYPWAHANARQSLNQLSSSVYVVSLEHSHGLLETYLDGATRSVFFEFQRLQVDHHPTLTTTTNETDDLELRVNRTYGTGPMEVTVVDALTHDPVDATVRVNGNRVGTTGDDGSLWTVTPHRQVRIVAEADNETVSTTFFAN